MSEWSKTFLKVLPDEEKDGEFKVFASNDVEIGNIYMEIDGFYVLDMIHRQGFIPSYMLRALADQLDEMNEPYQKQVDEWFNKERAENGSN